MSTIRINSPLPSSPATPSIPPPITVVVSWSIDAPIAAEGQERYEKAKKKYAEEQKKYEEELKKNNGDPTKCGVPPSDPPLPFLARLRIDGSPIYYQFHFDATYTGVTWTYSGVPIASGAQRIRAQLVMTMSSPLQSDDVLLDADSIPVSIT